MEAPLEVPIDPLAPERFRPLLGEEYAQTEAAIERAQALCASADVLLCIGTSLEVHPVAALPELTRAAGGEVVIITKGPTPWDDRAAYRLGGDVVEELDALVAAL
jgi:NAD-dependent deacetylase